MKFSNQRGARGTRRSRWKLLYVVIAILIVGAGVFAFVRIQRDTKPDQNATLTETKPEQTKPSEQAAPEPTPKVFSSELLQFLGGQTDSYGVMVTDMNGHTIAEINPDRPFRTESIYKLYAAYLGYQALDAGQVNGSEVYQAGRTRLECLDAMIRTSDSPCGEKLVGELGQSFIDGKLKELGLTDTSLSSYRTTARDSSRMLALIYKGEGLSESSKAKFLDSMQYQKWRSALPKGFPDSTVYDKVGFRDLIEYHDVAIVKLPDGRAVTVSIFTENIGTTRIAKLSAEINRLLQQ